MTSAPPRLDHEAILLGGLLSGRARLVDVPLTPAHFANPIYGAIFDAITTAAVDGQQPTQLQVLDAIRARPDATRILAALHGGRDLTDLADAAETQFGLTSWHVTPITEAATLRGLRREAERLMQHVEAAETGRVEPDDLPALLVERFTRALEITDPTPTRPGDAPRRTWQPVDITPVLDGAFTPPTPTVGRRDDGVGLFYPGRTHTVASETEGGKTWLALVAAATELAAGNAVAYLDFEDDEGGVVGRLLTLGARRDDIAARFAYLRPETPLADHGNTADLDAMLGDLRPTLAVLDGVTEAMTMHGLDINDNRDAATFGRLIPARLASAGAAVVALDHVTKSSEGRGRYQIGAVHKLNGVNGAAYMLDNRKPFGIGTTGRSTVYVTKDRPGQLRRHGLPTRDRLCWFADLTLASHSRTITEATLSAPSGDPEEQFRPTVLMGRVSLALIQAGRPLTQRDIESRVTGNAAHIRKALAVLIDEQYVTVEASGRSLLHTLVKPFADDSED